jgi:hypothetical protein
MDSLAMFLMLSRELTFFCYHYWIQIMIAECERVVHVPLKVNEDSFLKEIISGTSTPPPTIVIPLSSDTPIKE